MNERWATLEQPILAAIGTAAAIEWRSPLAADDFAEYRDAAFLQRVDRGHLASALAAFWPTRGPQWDALGLTDRGDVLLVEAKAHIGEFCTSGSAAGAVSRARIVAALDLTAAALGARPARAPWADVFYQLANRLAHLLFLRQRGVPAYLVLVNFVGDVDMRGPRRAAEWEAAYRVALHAMGLAADHLLAGAIIKAYPEAPTGR